MKKILLITLLCAAFNTMAQINFESNYPVTLNGQTWESSFHYIKTSTTEKFAVEDENANTIKIYNLNHSIYKTITIPTITVGAGSVIQDTYVILITDDLFNTDAKFEYAIEYQSYNSTTYKSGYFTYVYNEDGTVLFSKDSAQFGYINKSANEDVCVVKTSSGSKFLTHNDKYNDKSYDVYSLPGNLLATTNPQEFIPGLSYPFPNPSSEMTRIEFELPKGEHMGEILISSIEGLPVKKYLVDNSFGDLILNNTDLPTGTYLYQLKAGNNVSETKKMMIIK